MLCLISCFLHDFIYQIQGHPKQYFIVYRYFCRFTLQMGSDKIISLGKFLGKLDADVEGLKHFKGVFKA